MLVVAGSSERGAFFGVFSDEHNDDRIRPLENTKMRCPDCGTQEGVHILEISDMTTDKTDLSFVDLPLHPRNDFTEMILNST